MSQKGRFLRYVIITHEAQTGRNIPAEIERSSIHQRRYICIAIEKCAASGIEYSQDFFKCSSRFISVIQIFLYKMHEK